MSFSSFQKLSIPSEPQGSTNQMTEQDRAELFLNDCLALGSLRVFFNFYVIKIQLLIFFFLKRDLNILMFILVEKKK